MASHSAQILSFTTPTLLPKQAWSQDTGIPPPPFWEEKADRKTLAPGKRILWAVHEVDFSNSIRKKWEQWYQQELALPSYVSLSDEARDMLLLKRFILYR